jgi:hypothetical protein
MIEYDLVKIREALEKPSLLEAIQAMETVLKELGYTKQVLTPREVDGSQLVAAVTCPN